MASKSRNILSSNELGKFVRARRKRDGLTLVQAAGLINVGVRFLSELENGKPTLRLDRVLRVLDAYGLKLYLDDETGDRA